MGFQKISSLIFNKFDDAVNQKKSSNISAKNVENRKFIFGLTDPPLL